jgi:hypothetical protein
MRVRFRRGSRSQTVRCLQGRSRRLAVAPADPRERTIEATVALALRRLPRLFRLPPAPDWARRALRGAYSDFCPRPGRHLAADLADYLAKRLLGSITACVREVLRRFPPHIQREDEAIASNVFLSLWNRAPRARGDLFGLIRATARCRVADYCRSPWTRTVASTDQPARSTHDAFEFEDTLHALRAEEALRLSDFSLDVLRAWAAGERPADTVRRLGGETMRVYQERRRLRKILANSPLFGDLFGHFHCSGPEPDDEG